MDTPTCRLAPHLSSPTRAGSSRPVPSESSASPTFEVRIGASGVFRLWVQYTKLRRAGNLRSLNELAKQARADYIIHTGDFGFYDDTSLERIAEKYGCLSTSFGCLFALTRDSSPQDP